MEILGDFNGHVGILSSQDLKKKRKKERRSDLRVDGNVQSDTFQL